MGTMDVEAPLDVEDVRLGCGVIEGIVGGLGLCSQSILHGRLLPREIVRTASVDPLSATPVVDPDLGGGRLTRLRRLALQPDEGATDIVEEEHLRSSAGSPKTHLDRVPAVAQDHAAALASDPVPLHLDRSAVRLPPTGSQHRKAGQDEDSGE
jgi:hypothetical protein